MTDRDEPAQAGDADAGGFAHPDALVEDDVSRTRRVWGTTLRSLVLGAGFIIAVVRLPEVELLWGLVLCYFVFSLFIVRGARRGGGFFYEGVGRGLLVVVDITGITLASYAFGSQTSPLWLLYGPAVAGWSLQRGRPFGLLALLSSIGLYGSVLILEGVGVLPQAPLARDAAVPFTTAGGPIAAFALLAVSLGATYGLLRFALLRLEQQADKERRILASERAAEERSARLKSQLEQAQRLEGLGRLAGGVAHDFNNLLTAIVGYTECVGEALGQGHPSREDLEEVLRAAERARNLTSQLLAFSSKQVLRPAIVDLNRLISQLTRMLARIIGEDIELTCLLGEGLRPIRADSTHIEQVIVNLAVNARDAMPKGGKLSIETSNSVLVLADCEDKHEAKPGSYVLLRVADTGAGMDEKIRSKIFDPFFSTKAASKGTGLGLATVYGIVKQSGGFIEVESTPGRGTSFGIYFPPTRGKRVSMGAIEQPRERGDETVLVVEDEDVVRRLTRRILERQGYKVLEASSGKAALELSSTHSGSIDLLLTDVVMPEMSGPELAEKLLGERPGIHLLYMSGYADDVIAERGGFAKEGELIRKPFEAAALVAKVRERIDG